MNRTGLILTIKRIKIQYENQDKNHLTIFNCE